MNRWIDLVEHPTAAAALAKVSPSETRAGSAARARRVSQYPTMSHNISRQILWSRSLRGRTGGLMATLTWDRGLELAAHRTFSIATGVQVYFCDPRSPWQRGTNENTNGLLRQYFPRRTDLSGYSQRYLDAIARRLNTRPRKTLGYRTPADILADTVALTG